MRTKLLGKLSALVSVGVSALILVAGSPAHAIWHGTPASQGEFLGATFLSIRNHNGSTSSCTGVLIGESYVLTAKHCVANTSDGNVDLRIGSLSRSSGGEVRKSSTIIRHDRVDLALIKLNYRVVNVPRPARETNVNAATVRQDREVKVSMAGWGVSNTSQTKSPELLSKAEMTVIEMRILPKVENLPSDIDSEVIPTMNFGTGTLPGDSGGPIMSNGKLVGIISSCVSEKMIQHREMGQANDFLYSFGLRVAAFDQWISDNKVKYGAAPRL